MSISIEEFHNRPRPPAATSARVVTFLPEPEPRERTYTLVSVDDHVVEPPHTFEGRVPRRFVDAAPRVIDLDDGGQAWLYDGQVLPNVGLNAVVGRPRIESTIDPQRFDEMRPGTWDIHARVRDMDLDGTYASLCFPSFLAGFGGGRLQTVTKDPELALATVRAYNDWHLEEWAGTYPGRIIPNQLPYVLDPEVGAAEIRRNAARGFRAVTFPEAPEKLGLPSIHTRHWDPIIAACAETETVVCLHTGSGGTLPITAVDAPPETSAVLFGAYAVFTAVDWLFSYYPGMYPELKLCLSEGGIGWVAGLLDRLDSRARHLASDFPMPPGLEPVPVSPRSAWHRFGIGPREALLRNFWFCALDDPSSFAALDVIGAENVLLEVDYPHSDGTWPNSQAVLAHQLRGVPEDQVRMVTWENASRLFRHPVPVDVQRDPNAFRAGDAP